MEFLICGGCPAAARLETAHDLTLAAGWWKLKPPSPLCRSALRRRVTVLWLLTFPNPVGWRRALTRMPPLPDAMARLGLRLCRMRHRHAAAANRQSAGRACSGSAKTSTVINRMGFNNGGMLGGGEQSGGAQGWHLSASISAPTRTARTASAITALCFAQLAPLADYVTVNISSPNTPAIRN